MAILSIYMYIYIYIYIYIFLHYFKDTLDYKTQKHIYMRKKWLTIHFCAVDKNVLSRSLKSVWCVIRLSTRCIYVSLFFLFENQNLNDLDFTISLSLPMLYLRLKSLHEKLINFYYFLKNKHQKQLWKIS